MNMSKEIEQFIVVARRFCEWAESENSGDLQSAKQALELITELYLFGIRLVDEVQEANQATPFVESTEKMGSIIYAHASNLPLKYYSEVFNPLLIPAEEPVTGDLADDIADIHEDIRRGLDLLDAGYTEHAVWEWIFHMQHHWGEHATSAIRVLHWYLSEQGAFR
jgi:hypothetical protein